MTKHIFGVLILRNTKNSTALTIRYVCILQQNRKLWVILIQQDWCEIKSNLLQNGCLFCLHEQKRPNHGKDVSCYHNRYYLRCSFISIHNFLAQFASSLEAFLHLTGMNRQQCVARSFTTVGIHICTFMFMSFAEDGKQ